MQVGARFQNNYYLVPLRREPDTAAAQAIFVIKEQPHGSGPKSLSDSPTP